MQKKSIRYSRGACCNRTRCKRDPVYLKTRPRRVDFSVKKANLQVSFPDRKAEILEKYINIYLQLQVYLSIYLLTVSTYI